MGAFNQIGIDIVRVIFSLVIWILLMRILLQAFRADFYNPVSQSVVRLTAFLDPLRRVLGARAGIDFATLIALLLVQMAQLAAVYAMRAGSLPDISLLLAFAIPELLQVVLSFFFWIIIASVVASWLAPGGHSPVIQLLHELTEPLLAPARRLIPPLGGLDFSPILILLALDLSEKYGVPALRQLIAGLAG
ncbi:MAG: YggT family protein [Pararhodobacter sp.]|nr:YggT family protein [Pararhodobacter sp.]